MNDKDESVTYEFSYVNRYTEEQSTYSRTYPDAWVTWDTVLNDFLEFLQGCYGYDISKKVEYQSHDYSNFMTDQMDS